MSQPTITPAIAATALAGTDEPTAETRARDLGPGALLDAELLTSLLGTSDPAQLRDLLRRHRGLAGLVAAANAHQLAGETLEPELRHRLLAACELGRRLSRAELEHDLELLDRPAAVAGYLFARYARAGQMVVGALWLDLKRRLIGERELFRGSPTAVRTDRALILGEALRAGARSIVLFQVRTGGDATLTAADTELTRDLARAAEEVGVELADHVIVGDANTWFSCHQARAW